MASAAKRIGNYLKQFTRHARVPLFGNAYFLILTNLMPSAAGFFFWTLAARLMPAEEVGWGSALISTTALLVSLFGLDLGTGLIRYVPLSIEKSPDRVNTALGIRSILAALAAIAFVIGTPFWSPALVSIRATAVGVSIFVVGNLIMSINELLDHIFVAYRSAKYALIKSAVTGLVRFPALALLILANATHNGLGVYLSTIVSAAIANMIAIGWLLPKAYSPYRLRLGIVPSLIWDMAHYSVANYVVSFLLQLPNLIIPILVVNTALGAVGAGVSYVVSMVAWVVLVIPAAMSRSLLAEGAHDAHGLAQHTRRAITFSLLLVSVPVGAIMIGGSTMLRLLFGVVYQQHGSAMLALMSISALPATLFSVYVSLKRVKRQSRELIAVSAMVSVVSVGMGALLVNRWGLSGLGLGLLGGQLLGGLVSIPELWRTVRSDESMERSQ